jgi:hypothetical protein
MRPSEIYKYSTKEEIKQFLQNKNYKIIAFRPCINRDIVLCSSYQTDGIDYIETIGNSRSCASAGDWRLILDRE